MIRKNRQSGNDDERVLVSLLDQFHENWRESEKSDRFNASFLNFYFYDLPHEEDHLEENEARHFMYVDRDFIGLGMVKGDRILIRPYSSRKEFIEKAAEFIENHKRVAVYINTCRHTPELESLVLSLRNECNLHYDGTVIGPKPDEYLSLQ